MAVYDENVDESVAIADSVSAVKELVASIAEVVKTAPVSAQLNFEGADTSTTFTDDTGKVWTASGNAQIDTAQFKTGSASGLFDGSGDYISTPSHADFNFGTGDFTVEFWFRHAAAGSAYYCQSDQLGSSTNDKWYAATSGGVLRFTTHSGGGPNLTYAWTPTVGQWYHYAATRKNGYMRLFLDGVQVAQDPTGWAAWSLSQNGMVIGAISTPFYMNGWIDGFRVLKGAARYTGPFTPRFDLFTLGDEEAGWDRTITYSGVMDESVWLHDEFLEGIVAGYSDTLSIDDTVIGQRDTLAAIAESVALTDTPNGTHLGEYFPQYPVIAPVPLGFVGRADKVSNQFTLQGQTHTIDVWSAYDGTLEKSRIRLRASGTLDTPLLNPGHSVDTIAESNNNIIRASLENVKTLSGTVYEEGVPCKRLVRLYRRSDGMWVAQTYSDATTGAFSFTKLRNQEYFAIAFDDETLNPDYNAIVWDRLVPG